MRWKVFNKTTPIDGQSCIVSYLMGRCSNKRSIGIFVYHSGISPVWESRSGSTECHSNDCWCLVDDIIENVMDRVLEDMNPFILQCNI